MMIPCDHCSYIVVEFLSSFNVNLMKKIIPIEEGDFYLTPEGYRCFTEQYHLKRGHCCQSGCRHCPYGYDKATNSIKK